MDKTNQSKGRFQSLINAWIESGDDKYAEMVKNFPGGKREISKKEIIDTVRDFIHFKGKISGKQDEYLASLIDEGNILESNLLQDLKATCSRMMRAGKNCTYSFIKAVDKASRDNDMLLRCTQKELIQMLTEENEPNTLDNLIYATRYFILGKIGKFEACLDSDVMGNLATLAMVNRRENLREMIQAIIAKLVKINHYGEIQDYFNQIRQADNQRYEEEIGNRLYASAGGREYLERIIMGKRIKLVRVALEAINLMSNESEMRNQIKELYLDSLIGVFEGKWAKGLSVKAGLILSKIVETEGEKIELTETFLNVISQESGKEEDDDVKKIEAEGGGGVGEGGGAVKDVDKADAMEALAILTRDKKIQGEMGGEIGENVVKCISLNEYCALSIIDNLIRISDTQSFELESICLGQKLEGIKLNDKPDKINHQDKQWNEQIKKEAIKIEEPIKTDEASCEKKEKGRIGTELNQSSLNPLHAKSNVNNKFAMNQQSYRLANYRQNLVNFSSLSPPHSRPSNPYPTAQIMEQNTQKGISQLGNVSMRRDEIPDETTDVMGVCNRMLELNLLGEMERVIRTRGTGLSKRIAIEELICKIIFNLTLRINNTGWLWQRGAGRLAVKLWNHIEPVEELPNRETFYAVYYLSLAFSVIFCCIPANLLPSASSLYSPFLLLINLHAQLLKIPNLFPHLPYTNSITPQFLALTSLINIAACPYSSPSLLCTISHHFIPLIPSILESSSSPALQALLLRLILALPFLESLPLLPPYLIYFSPLLLSTDIQVKTFTLQFFAKLSPLLLPLFSHFPDIMTQILSQSINSSSLLKPALTIASHIYPPPHPRILSQVIDNPAFADENDLIRLARSLLSSC